MPATLLSDNSGGGISVRFNTSAPVVTSVVSSPTSISVTCPPNARVGETWGQLLNTATGRAFATFRFAYVWPATQISIPTIPMDGTDLTIKVCRCTRKRDDLSVKCVHGTSPTG